MLQQGYVIPANNGFYEPIRTLEQIFKSDKGSMIISPQVGLNSNVAVLDYDSEYPNIIVRNNLSYETVTDCGLRKDAVEGLLPKVMKRYLSRRTFFQAGDEGYRATTTNTRATAAARVESESSFSENYPCFFVWHCRLLEQIWKCFDI